MLHASYALVQGTVGVGTVLVWDFCVAITRGAGYLNATNIVDQVKCVGGEVLSSEFSSYRSPRALPCRAVLAPVFACCATGAKAQRECAVLHFRSIRQKHFLETQQYQLIDRKAEASHGFTLAEARARVEKKGPVFKGWTFFITPKGHVNKGTVLQLEIIVACAGVWAFSWFCVLLSRFFSL